MKGVARAAGIGAAAAILGTLALGRAPAGVIVVGDTVCDGDVEVFVTVNDCGAGEEDAVVLGRWRGACGAFAVEVPTVGPGIGHVCAYQRAGDRIERAARHRGAGPSVLRLQRVVR